MTAPLSGIKVIKIEAMGQGDPLRKWRKLHDGTSLWWYLQSRNKKSLALDLKSAQGLDLIKQLLGDADVLIESLRPAAWKNLVGIATGIDLPHLLQMSRRLPALLGHDLPGQVAKAGRNCDLHPPPA